MIDYELSSKIMKTPLRDLANSIFEVPTYNKLSEKAKERINKAVSIYSFGNINRPEREIIGRMR